ncbi:MAG TPA: DNA topoisomerase III [Candidatus Acidoferrales bacterium]|jgi:DNA topoisomerase-3|nr:DNA topoisomerase III [Candidatus Acidoferrales bacterium]
MGKALIIAEKPSVASDISKALGKFQKHEDHFENDDYVISSAVGHLLTIVPPEGVEAARGKWTFKCLPVIPPHFDLTPIEKNEKRLKALAKLIKRKDVDKLVNACDAGREGELIFRNIVKYTKAKQPIQRLWLQSMTPAAIREGFASLKSDESMQPLSDAATSRSEADWLVGINGTRAMTAFNSKLGGFFKTTVGRVQTPTLAILVEREAKIRKFVPRGYWEVIGTFDAAAGNYTGRWFDEKFSKSEDDEQLKAERVWDVAKAEEIRTKCLGKPGIVTEESKPTTSMSPLLYDLTSLQRDANSRFGFSAKNTLGLAQALYEKHKVLTYPRTDSRALPEDYVNTVKDTLKMLGEVTGYSTFADQILKGGWVHPNKRIFNNAKVSDHFAIIPTMLAPKALSEPEQKLYDLVTKRFLAIFYPAAEFLETNRITRVEGEPFKSAGKVLVSPGWLTVYGKQSDSDETPSLAPVKPGETVKTSAIEVKENITKPPARYSEATLLSAMEGAGKLIDDDELREAMSEKGLGTPATRAATIEGLIYEDYVHRNGRELQATAKAFSLMELLNGLGIPELTKPELTGDWEFQLKEMQRKKISREQFMSGIADMTRRIVECAKKYEYDTIPGDFGTLKVPCPKCGGEVHERYKQFQCEKCDFAFWKTLCSRMFEIEEVEKIITDKVVGPLQGFRSKQGFPFAAVLRMTAEHKVEFDFGNGGKDGEPAAVVDFTGKEVLGKCPKCGGNVYDNGMNYVCEKQTGPTPTCDFRSGKIILQQEIPPEQIKKLLAEGKTDLLTKFISKKNNRPFKAFLIVKDGKTAFDFPPREGKGRTRSSEPPPKIDFTGKAIVGKCPKCGGQVFDTEAGYICENSQRAEKRCTFKPIGKTILEQPIDAVQAAKILKDKKSDVMEKFISKSGKPFPAFLVMDKKGKITFEFPASDDE